MTRWGFARGSGCLGLFAHAETSGWGHTTVEGAVVVLCTDLVEDRGDTIFLVMTIRFPWGREEFLARVFWFV